MIEDFPEESWVVRGEYLDQDWFGQYSEGFFRAISHFYTLGYGKGLPETLGDLWVTMFSMVFGAILWAVFIGNAKSLLEDLSREQTTYALKLEEVENWLEDRKCPNELRNKVYEFYETRFAGKIFDENKIFNLLNENLHVAILQHVVRDLISAMKIWYDADPLFIDEVIMMLKSEFFQASDMVVKEGDMGTKMYFIEDGIVEIYASKAPTPSVVTFLSEGNYFGGKTLGKFLAAINYSQKSASLCARKEQLPFELWEIVTCIR